MPNLTANDPLGGALPRELTGRTRYRAWGIV
ncbi:helix-turn-helix domain-containing protein [Microvirga tunisiensis]|uniref:HTH DNA binding domain-containing protein n=1 Tax=Microvirga tunisiensis TaxID=2108360 RepID=A0A5N7MP72_9HYPH|nr:helix-turn-helix domain-containing protein [Microvirga tunisiensis]MPR10469.1 hypothetical protein [Microvirga tunisiensis]MPR28638.1 hypothetical protein [Microvirga tunisiensis]